MRDFLVSRQQWDMYTVEIAATENSDFVSDRAEWCQIPVCTSVHAGDKDDGVLGQRNINISIFKGLLREDSQIKEVLTDIY